MFDCLVRRPCSIQCITMEGTPPLPRLQEGQAAAADGGHPGAAKKAKEGKGRHEGPGRGEAAAGKQLACSDVRASNPGVVVSWAHFYAPATLALPDT